MTSDKRASEEALAGLHAQVARSLADLCKETVEEEETLDDEGNVTSVKRRKVKPAPAALAVARAFLKDNNITATPAQSSALEELERALKDPPSKAELKEAERLVSKGLLQ